MIVLFDKWRMPKGHSWLITIIIVPTVEKIHRRHLQKASGGFVIGLPHVLYLGKPLN